MPHPALLESLKYVRNPFSSPKPSAPKVSGFEAYNQRESKRESTTQASSRRPVSRQIQQDPLDEIDVSEELSRAQLSQPDTNARTPDYRQHEQMLVQPIQNERAPQELPYPQSGNTIMQPAPVDRIRARQSTYAPEIQNPFEPEQTERRPRTRSYQDEIVRVQPRQLNRDFGGKSHPHDGQYTLRPEQTDKVRKLEEMILRAFNHPPATERAFEDAAIKICVQVATYLKFENQVQQEKCDDVWAAAHNAHRIELKDTIANNEWKSRETSAKISSLNDENSALRKRADQDLREIERLKKKADLKQLKSDLAQARDQVARLQAVNEAQKSDIAARRKMVTQLETDLAAADRTTKSSADLHAVELARKDQDLKAQLEAQKKSQSVKMRSAEEDLRKARETLEKQQNTHGQQVETLKAQHDKLITEQRLQYDGKLQQSLTALEAIKAQAARNAQQMSEEHAIKVSQLQQDHKADLNRMEGEMNDLATSLAKQHADETRGLSVEVQAINEVLLTRDQEVYLASLFSTADLPRKPDDKIKDSLTHIQKQVEEVAHTSWKRQPEGWTQQDLSRASGQHVERLVKKAIVQDMIWTSLFRLLFCSPFRVFGQAGQEFEAEWKTECGEDAEHTNQHYVWPAPSLTTERWRYMTLKGCHEVLSKPVPSSRDPRAAVKMGFKQNLERMSETVCQELGTVIDVTPSIETAVSRLCKSAAIAWLDLSMHRCRIVLQLPGDALSTTSEKIAQLQQEKLTLTVNPRLGRHDREDSGTYRTAIVPETTDSDVDLGECDSGRPWYRTDDPGNIQELDFAPAPLEALVRDSYCTRAESQAYLVAIHLWPDCRRAHDEDGDYYCPENCDKDGRSANSTDYGP